MYQIKILKIKLRIFSYPSVSLFVLGAQENRLIETVLLSTHNICFGGEKSKYSKKNSGIISVSHCSDPVQAQGYVGPDLGLKCLRRLSRPSYKNV